MGRINYTKEWQRIITTLERTEVRFVRELTLSATDEERNEARAKLKQIRSQLAHARRELDRVSLVKPYHSRVED